MHKEFEFVNDHKTPGLRTWFGLLDLRIRACQFVKQTKNISGSSEFTIYDLLDMTAYPRTKFLKNFTTTF